MTAPSSSGGLLVGNPNVAVRGACLCRLQSEYIGRSNGKKVMQLMCEWGISESRCNAG